MAFQIFPDMNLSACYPLSHLLRKCQLSQRESREVGANFLPYVQTKLVSPSGRDVAQRQRGLVPAGMAFQICPDTNLSACCPLSHLLRKCQLSQRESREAGANLFALTHKPNLSLPLGEMSRSDREGWYQLTWLFKLSLTRAFLSCAQTKTEHLSILCLLVGGGGFAFLWKSHAGCNMHPACCQEPAFESTAPILNLEGKTKESTGLYSLLWWEVVDSNHRSR